MSDTDSEICDRLAVALFARGNGHFAKAMKHSNEKEKTVLRIWHLLGIVGNSGFEEVFSQDVFGAEGYLAVEDDLRAIGAEHAANLVSKAVTIHRLMISSRKKGLAELMSQLNGVQSDFDAEENNIVKRLVIFIASHLKEHTT